MSMVGALVLLAGGVALSQASDAPKYSADVPASITTPDTVQTSVGALKFQDGAPDKKQSTVYDVDLAAGIEAFMQGVPATSVYAACHGVSRRRGEGKPGLRHHGGPDGREVPFPHPEHDHRLCLHLPQPQRRPVVLEAPPGVLGPGGRRLFPLGDGIGLTGPDQGKGGKYLFVPPGYTGDMPAEGYYVSSRPPTGC